MAKHLRITHFDDQNVSISYAIGILFMIQDAVASLKKRPQSCLFARKFDL